LHFLSRVVGFGLLLLAALLPLAALAALLGREGPDALLALGPSGWAMLAAATCLPAGLLLLGVMAALQRAELNTLRTALLRQGSHADRQHLALEALMGEARDQTALLQEQVRLLLSGLSLGQRQAEATQALFTETRLQRLVAEWDLTGQELHALLAAMWRLAFGWRVAAGSPGEGGPLLLPSADELPLAVLRLLPASAEEMARFEVDERFVRQAARYRATFAAFLDHVPETGPLNRALFRDMVLGRLDARLALLPRPDHGRLPDRVAAE